MMAITTSKLDERERTRTGRMGHGDTYQREEKS